jgi:asparagine synthase (glutamine-hydrolysing)
MSVFCLHWRRDGAPPDRAAVARGYARLAPRVPAAGESAAADDCAALAGTAGAPAIAHDAAARATLLWDGRLADRTAWAAALDMPASCADAALVLAAWRRDGAAALARLRGSFALALVDRREQRLLLARDPLGERALYYRGEPHQVWVASEPLAVLDAAALAAEPDPAAVAAYFALRAPDQGRAYLRGVLELRPGELKVIEARAERSSALDWGWSRTWRRARDDVAYAEALHETAGHAFAAAIGDAVRPALSLSGGIDSTLLAAAAAGAGLAPRVHILGWTLPATPDADERRWIEAVACSAPYAGVDLVDGDGCWPLSDWPHGPRDPNLPVANPYRALKHALLRRARELGIDVLVSGHYGDHGYPDPTEWLRGALGARRFVPAWRELAARRRGGGWRGLLRDPGLRAVWRGRGGRARLPPWLSRTACEALAAWRPWPASLEAHPNAAVARALLGLESAHDAAHERPFAERLGIEIRYPYRDPQLVDLLLALPPDVHHRHGIPKALARLALRGRVPEPVRLRPKSGSLAPLFRRGVREHVRALVETLLWHRDAGWPQYLRREALERAWRQPQAGEGDDLLVWLALSHELWWRGLAENDPVIACRP